MSVTKNVVLACLLVHITVGFTGSGLAQGKNKQPAQTETGEMLIAKASLGSTRNVHRLQNLFFAGQFSPEDIKAIKTAMIGRVISLRTVEELDWDERSVAEAAGLKFEQIPVAGADGLTDEVFDSVRRLLEDKSKPTLLHCGSANRVGGVWLTSRVLNDGVDLQTAIEEAKTIGLRSPAIQQKALDYIHRKQSSAGSDAKVGDTLDADK